MSDPVLIHLLALVYARCDMNMRISRKFSFLQTKAKVPPKQKSNHRHCSKNPLKSGDNIQLHPTATTGNNNAAYHLCNETNQKQQRPSMPPSLHHQIFNINNDDIIFNFCNGRPFFISLQHSTIIRHGRRWSR